MLRRWSPKVGRWTVRAVLAAIFLVLLDLAFLTFPMPLFAHKVSCDEFTVYSNEPIPDGFEQVIEDARMRVAAMDHARPGQKCRVFLCGSQRLYSVFTFLTRRGSDSLGLGLTIAHNIYLNQTKIRRFAAEHSSALRHSRYEGNPSEVIAHEIVHFNMVRALGWRRAIGLPVWLSEGYAEYQANLHPTRTDPGYLFAHRIELYLDRSFWGGGSGARRVFGWQLLVEYLADVKGMTLESLAEGAVTEASALQEMIAWYHGATSSG